MRELPDGITSDAMKHTVIMQRKQYRRVEDIEVSAGADFADKMILFPQFGKIVGLLMVGEWWNGKG